MIKYFKKYWCIFWGECLDFVIECIRPLLAFVRWLCRFRNR